jgi:mono/diheme cytochrome c family protein
MSFSRETEGTADPAAGKIVYEAACTFCHGAAGEGGHGGGKALAVRSADTVVLIVSEGRNDMPPFGGALTPEQIRDVSAYVADMH